MRLVGGAKGLDRAVRWIYFGDVIDDMDHSPEWINGHELVIYSGTAFDGSSQRLAQNLRKLNDMDIAGLIINVGPYIPEIPQEVIETADELKLPLFRLPWEIKLVNITHAICNAIISNEMQESRASSMLEGLLFGDMKSPKELEEILSSNQLVNEKGYVVGVCTHTNKEILDKLPEDLEGNAVNKNILQRRFEDALAWERIHAVTMTKRNGDVVFLTPNYPDIRGKLTRIQMFLEKETSCRCPGIEFRIGFAIAEDIRSDIKKCYKHACLALDAMDMSHDDERIIDYENLGMASLLLNVSDYSVLKKFYSKTLGALIEYDKVNRTDLYQTLESYFDNNSDLQTTAQKLFIHKNTLKYRLERIGEILGSNIRKTNDFLLVGIALQIGKILSARSSHAEDAQND